MRQWRPVNRGDLAWEFTARHSGKCLDVTDFRRLTAPACSSGRAPTAPRKPFDSHPCKHLPPGKIPQASHINTRKGIAREACHFMT
ncbi:hypothetical protein ACF09Y_26525 [Streptomyces massasporeus]|uniref:hypothetical protein n=1 Tax=Streptomyces massasporeus TaxID=67324 RepID=UPI0036FE5348